MKESNFIFGVHSVLQALQDAQPIDQIFIKKQSDNELIREIIYLARKQRVTIKSVPIEKINRITRKNHQGVVAFVSPIDFYDLHAIVPSIYEQGKVPFFIVLDEVTDIRNFGAIVRSAECMGADAIIIPQRGAAQISADAVQTSAGALLKMPICKVKSLVHACQFLKDSGLHIFSASEKFSQACYDSNFTQPLAIILGAEDVGISQELIALSDSHIHIPMVGEINSLNVSVAAGICFYEILKQRQHEAI